jgi:glucan biosynthesis protein C
METKNVGRRYDVDWLRVLAFSAVFLYHCGRFFDTGYWNIKNNTSSALVDTLVGIFDLWGMPLIFMISGASIFFALRPGRAAKFLADRGKRLLVPLAFGILVLAPPQVYLARLTHGEFQGSFLQFLPLCFRDWRIWNGNFAWSGVHLWYLEDLFLLTLVFLPLFVALKRPAGRRGVEMLATFSARPGAVLLWALPFALVGFVVDPLGLVWGRLSEDLVRLIVFAPFLVYGFLVFSDGRVQEAIIRQRRVSLALALISTLSVPVVGGIIEGGIGLSLYALVAVLIGILIWSSILAVLGYGMRYLTGNRRALAYANEAVLPFYILHQPVILILGFFVIPLPLPILVKYLIIAPSAFCITLGLYEYGIRRVNPVRRIFGLKPRKPVLPAADLAAQPLA